MGGSGGGTVDFGKPGGGGGSGSPKGDPCKTFAERTALSSPKAPALKKAKAGDLLELELTNGASPVRALHGGQLVGTVVPESLLLLVQCMQQGNKYVAKVLKISGGSCTVEVRPKK